MSALSVAGAWADRGRELASRAGWLGPLLARLSVGAMFAGSGWGKLGDLGSVTEFFTELGIPAPGFHARLVAITELAGGVAIALGLGTRLLALPLAVTMIVATITAKRSDIEGVRSLLALEEITYLSVLLWLVVAGAGAASVDALICRARRSRPASAPGVA